MSRDVANVPWEAIVTSGSAFEGYDDELATANDLKVTVRTLRKWRGQGVGPPYVVVARRFYYSRTGRVAWLKAREQIPVRSERAA